VPSVHLQLSNAACCLPPTPPPTLPCVARLQVFGSLTAGWEEDDSTGDDNSSVGVLSHGGSSESFGPKAAAAGTAGGVGGMGDDSIEGEGSILPSEDSGF
jgi:hypothetical protein